MKRIATYDNRYKQAVENPQDDSDRAAGAWLRAAAAAAGRHCIKNGRAAQGAQPVL